jgi:hypothetical protein
MANPAPSLHRLAAHNVVAGLTEFLSLPLPPPWRVTRAVVTPEVGTTMRTESRLWVASGETRHVVFDREKNRGLDLVVRISQGAPRLRGPGRQVLDEGLALAGGHEARYRIVRRGRGLFMRGDEEALLVAFTCPVTARGVAIEISGAATVDELREFLRAMPGVECH